MSRRKCRSGLVVAMLFVLATVTVLTAAPPEKPTVAKADKLWELKHYKEAADAYAGVVKARAPKWHYAAERRIMSLLRLNLFDDALKAAETNIADCHGTYFEARAERLTANLYMSLPHWGTRHGGEFYRGEHRQGTRLETWRYDKNQAVQHMERARELYAAFEDPDRLSALLLNPKDSAGWRAERIECIFDLSSLIAKFSIYSGDPFYWHAWWGQRDDFLAETAGEKDFDEGYRSRDWSRKRPIGLRLDAKDEPIFASLRKAYTTKLSDDAKIIFLLNEVRGLDVTDNKKFAGLSVYRQAMLARMRFGMDRLNNHCRRYYSNGRRPLQEELDTVNPWEMADNEALLLAGGKVRTAILPADFDVLALLNKVNKDYPNCGVADQAAYAAGVYRQSRQQYKRAIGAYEDLIDSFPKSKWTPHAVGHITQIGVPQVRLSDSGVLLPGEPAELQVSYRNMKKVWFVARRIDTQALLAEVRDFEIANDGKQYQRRTQMLQSWHRPYAWRKDYHLNQHNQWMVDLAAKHVGKEIHRWSSEVEDDGSHRYAHVTLGSPLLDRGAYLVYAYKNEVPEADAQKTGKDAILLGASRAVFALTDLAIVEKSTTKGRLYFVCNAVTGAPVPGASVSLLETWTERGGRNWINRAVKNDLHADDDGMLVFPGTAPRNSNVHALVTGPDGELAWSGMRWLNRHRGRGVGGEGYRSYVLTDRPVYRPGQEVHVKAWIRQMMGNEYVANTDGVFTVSIRDPKGNEVLSMIEKPDEFGAIDCDFLLGEEPPLGAYHISIRIPANRNRHVGSQQFRVEEYKKPEFEVTVEPGKTHARLGEELVATINAKYYFGGGVAGGNVKYKVFREEYRHSYYPYGEWDWLYGAGYGQPWFDNDWLPWWGAVRSCRIAPPWWGYRSYNPVRELVMQGAEPLDEHGKLELTIDTAPALKNHPDTDHRYIVQAEVTDSSRRTIVGEGAVKVTRSAYYATVNSDRGYYRPGEEMVLNVKCMTPDGKPVKTDGVVTISSIVYGGPNNAKMDEQKIDSFKASTDERGVLSIRHRYERSGQLKVKFSSPDSWGGQVDGYALVWYVGKDFNGRLYRSNELEMVTDKRTYEPGEICHLMINTNRANSYVLVSDDAEGGTMVSYKLINLPTGHTVIDIPVRDGHRPNFFVEATLVSDARVHQQMERICVPPEEAVIELNVETDKPEYKPGEEATVKITAKDRDGEPLDVQVALSAFDKSVLYIQPEFNTPIRKYFHGRLRYHHTSMSTNLLERFSAFGFVTRPFTNLGTLPPDWYGTWSPTVEGWSHITDKEFAALGGMVGAYMTRLQGGRGAMEKSAGAPAPMAPGAPVMDSARNEAEGADDGGAATVQPKVRSEFADTALWMASIRTGDDGVASHTFKMPENLTTWKLNAWGMSHQVRVGQDTTEAVTTKNLLVRLQAPRFFVEYDEVVVSAIVHNYLEDEKEAKVTLDIPGEMFAFLNCLPTMQLKVKAGGHRRVDWRLKVLKEGLAPIIVKALTDEESDAMQMTFPVLVHGILKADSYCGSMRPDELKAVREFTITVPELRRPEVTRLEVQFAPSLVGAMMDALPYCLDYPWRSTDAEVYRFAPAVLTLKTLKQMGVDLEDVQKIRGRLAEVEAVEAGENIRRRCFALNPIFDSDEMHKIINTGLNRIEQMQHRDGGWSWWGRGNASPWFTATILDALITAREAGVDVKERTIQRGAQWLLNYDLREMREKHWSPNITWANHAFVLSRVGKRVVDQKAGDMVDRLFKGRDKLNLYGKAMLSMALANLKDEDRGRTVLRNIMQQLQENKETEIAWFRTPQQGWWYWYNSEIETNAMCLRALVKLEPQSDVSPRLVKWLLENRRNGYYWRSQRDTAQCIAAMAEYAVAAGEADPDYTLTINLDGKPVKKVHITKANFFEFDNQFVVEGVALEGGEHKVTLTKEGKGALYYSAQLRYFTKEKHIPASGLQLKVARTYMLLKQIPFEVEVEDAEGNKIMEKRLRYQRIQLEDGDRVESGDLIQVELKLTSDNEYTYLVIEDMKPAGCEPVDLRSGGKTQEGFWSNMELRDEKVVFFIRGISRGDHLMRYRLRAEVPGVFHALPTIVQGVYVPDLRGNAAEHVMPIVDKP